MDLRKESIIKFEEEMISEQKGNIVSSSVLYLKYLEFCSKNNFYPSSTTMFGKVFSEKYNKIRTGKGNCYLNIEYGKKVVTKCEHCGSIIEIKEE